MTCGSRLMCLNTESKISRGTASPPGGQSNYCRQRKLASYSLVECCRLCPKGSGEKGFRDIGALDQSRILLGDSSHKIHMERMYHFAHNKCIVQVAFSITTSNSRWLSSSTHVFQHSSSTCPPLSALPTIGLTFLNQ